MKTIKIEEAEYTIEKNYKDGYNEEDFKEKYTEYFKDFDYIFGDYSYDKLRLKGFNEKGSKINDISRLDEYINEFCSYECRYYLLKKVKK